ncbi:MAG: WVD2 family protein [Methylocystaceae bacterium]|nr:WVD2 family protein [Methylocystaceae bacterium]
MDEILTFLSTYRLAISLILVLLVTTIILIKWWSEVKLFWKSTFYSMPIIGKTKKLAQNAARASDGWYHSEKVLCEDFYSDIRDIAADPEMYDKAKSYLSKVQENGRKNLSIFMWIVIIGLVFVESLGFAYILSGYTLPGASEGLQVKGALGIAFLISAVLVWLTHAAGSEMHKRGLIKKARVWWNHDNDPDRPALKPQGYPTLEKNEEDDQAPQYIQIINRLDTNAQVTQGTPIWTMIAFLAILVIAVGATVVRYETYKQEKVAETSFVGSERTGELSLESLMDKSLPSDLTAPQKEADNRATQEKEDAADTANFTTFAILAVLFILIQAMGIGIGHRYGFAGKESKLARQIIGNFKSRSEYESWFERKKAAITMVAQKHLTNLQAQMRNYTQAMGIDQADRDAHMNSGNRTFEVFFNMKQQPVNQAKTVVETKTDLKPESSLKKEETQEEMEARLRAELLAEKTAQEAPKKETEEEMRKRLRKEMLGQDAE